MHVPATTNKARLMRTLRCRNKNVIGTLANLIATLSNVGADIGLINTVSVGELYNVRDISVMANNEAHMDAIIEAVRALANVTLMQVIDEVLDLHQGGKICVKATHPVTSINDLRKVYTPGVAQVCTLIKREPHEAFNYTTVQRNVALVTNGSRVLGLGNLGPLASLPVMEGKCALFAQLTGLNMFPILVNSRDPKVVIDTIVEIASGFGAIQLEDIEAPACFAIEEGLMERLDKPVMHDDQHGTAVVALAAAINACKLSGRDLRSQVFGQIGLGAAGCAIARLVQAYVGHPILGSDTNEEAVAKFTGLGGTPSTLPKIMEGCDVVIATTGRKGLIKPEMIRPGQIILALSNPYPEIDIDAALQAGAAFASDGTRVNNLLGYPGIFRGALEVRATRINLEMLLAAAQAIAEAAPERELVPNALDPQMHVRVARAVAVAAAKSGVARISPDSTE